MIKSFKDKNILVAGLGKSGIAVLDALKKEGAILSVCDNRNIEKDDPELHEKLKENCKEAFLGGAPVADEAWDMLVLSPGIPLSLDFVENAKKRESKIIGEIELAYLLGHGQYVAITGTNGKTTTTTLLGEIFSAADYNTVVAGNIGIPVISQSPEATDDTWFVTEVSSFQLETIDKFRPRIAVILNLTPDHMDRHITMENYAAAKARVFENQQEEDILVYNADDEVVEALVKSARSSLLPFSRKKTLATGAYLLGDQIVYNGPGCKEPISVLNINELGIPGTHNIENALAATAAAFAAGVSPEIITEALKSFKGVENRIEFVHEIEGIRFVNDSKGTNPDAAIKAIEAISEKSDIILIAGGYDKGTDFSEFIRVAKEKVKKLVLLGTTAEKIRKNALDEGFSDRDIFMTEGMNEAVRIGFELAEPGDTVLLSPACASWDMYENYEERGNHFKSSVAELETQK